jgi:DNA-binding transcriptional ArsR family regulator
VNLIKCKYSLFLALIDFLRFSLTLFTVISITCEGLSSKDALVNWCALKMPAKKVRVEIFNNGDRYIITFEGQVTREKTLRLLDLIELLGGMPTIDPQSNRSASELSKIEKVRLVAEKKFPIGWFSSTDIQSVYEKQFGEPIRLSTISTYLSRLAERGILTKRRTANQRSYKMMNIISGYQIRERK